MVPLSVCIGQRTEVVLVVVPVAVASLEGVVLARTELAVTAAAMIALLSVVGVVFTKVLVVVAVVT